jgi:hypothetical protein
MRSAAGGAHLSFLQALHNPEGIPSSSPGLSPRDNPWSGVELPIQPERGCDHRRASHGTTPLRLVVFYRFTQDSSCLATLGFGAQPRWCCKKLRCACGRAEVLSLA